MTDAPDDGLGPDVDLTSCVGRSLGSECDDGNPCTREDRCGAMGCEGIPYRCDDGLSCTEDRCDGAGGCSYPLKVGECLIGGSCFGNGVTKADDPCRVCAGGQAWSPNDGGPCEDGDSVCTLGDTCDGFECVGGPRPSDAATDWVLRPLSVEVPSAAVVWGVGRAGLNDALIVVSANGASSLETTTGQRALLGNSVMALRRTAQGLVAPLIYDGFERAQVRAFRPPTTTSNHFALGVELEGSGSLVTLSGTSVVHHEHRTSELVVADATGTLTWRASWPHELDDVALASTLGVIVGGRTWEIEFEGSGGPVSPIPGTAYVAGLDFGGAPSWAVTMQSATSEAFEGSVRICPTNGGVIASTTFVDSLVVSSTVSQPETFHATDGLIPTPVIAWIDGDGSHMDVLLPFAWTSRPQPEWAVPAGPFLGDCSDQGVLIFVTGRPSPIQPEPSRLNLDGAELGGTLVRLNRSGSVEWFVDFENVGLGFDRPTFLATTSDILAAWSKGNTITGSIVDSTGERVTIGDAAVAGVVRFDRAGRHKGIHVLTESPAFVFSMDRLPNGTLLLGGALLYAGGFFNGADSPWVLPASADVTPYVLGMNTNKGLECALE